MQLVYDKAYFFRVDLDTAYKNQHVAYPVIYKLGKAEDFSRVRPSALHVGTEFKRHGVCTILAKWDARGRDISSIEEQYAKLCDGLSNVCKSDEYYWSPTQDTKRENAIRQLCPQYKTVIGGAEDAPFRV